MAIPQFTLRTLLLQLYLLYSCNYVCSIMIANPQIQRKCDHRLQAIVKSEGSFEIALEPQL